MTFGDHTLDVPTKKSNLFLNTDLWELLPALQAATPPVRWQYLRSRFTLHLIRMILNLRPWIP